MSSTTVRKNRLSRRPTLDALEPRELMATNIAISEVVPNPFPSRFPNQYIELEGPAGASLSNYQFVQFNGFSGTSGQSPNGVATVALDLSHVSGGTIGQQGTITSGSAATFGSNGLLLIEATVGGPPPLESATNVLKYSGFNVGTSLPTSLGGGSQFFALIHTDGTHNITVGNSYAPAGTSLGTLGLPGNDTLVDAVSFLFDSAGSVPTGKTYVASSDGSDVAYSVTETLSGTTTPIVFPGTAFFLPVRQNSNGITPDAASRAASDNTVPGTNTAYLGTGHYNYGWLNSGNQFYDSSNDVLQSTQKNDAALTPGGDNGDRVVSMQSQQVYNVGDGTTTYAINVIGGNGSLTDHTSGFYTVAFNFTPGTALTSAYNILNSSNTLTFAPSTDGTANPFTQTILYTVSTGFSGDYFDVNLGTATGFSKPLRPNHTEVDIS